MGDGALEAVGAIAARGRNVEQAARLLGAAERLRQETGIDRFPLVADRLILMPPVLEVGATRCPS